jgi:glutamate synthase domain-containing protein 1
MPPSPDHARCAARSSHGLPPKQGLYDPWYEHDSCGVGFVVDIKGRKSNRILKQAIQVLRNLDHRGAAGSESNTGDGAGVLIQMPHSFLKEACKKARIALPGPGEYGSGLIFLPRDRIKRRRLEERFEQLVQSEGQTCSAGGRCRSTTRPSARRPSPASR